MFSLFNFFLIGFLSKYGDSAYFSQFVKDYSIVSLIFVLFSVMQIQPFATNILKSESEKKYFVKAFPQVFVFIFVLEFFVCFSLLLFVNWPLRHVLIILFLSSGWCLIDFLRKYNFSIKKGFVNFYITISYYVVFIFLFSFFYFFIEYNFSAIVSVSPLILGCSFLFVFFIYLFVEFGLLVLIKDKLDFNVTENYFHYGKYLVLGSFFFWGYTQGVFLFLDSFLGDGEVRQLRTIQNITSLISIVMVYFESKYIVYISGINKNDLKERLMMDTKKICLYGFFIIILFFLVIMIVLKMMYGYKWDVWGYTLIFLLSGFSFFISRPLLVYLRYESQTKYILYSHLFAFFSVVLFWFVLSVNENVSVEFVFVLPAVIFTVSIFILTSLRLSK